MPTLRTLLAALGTTGATANARAALEQRRRDELAVAGLLARVPVPARRPTDVDLDVGAAA